MHDTMMIAGYVIMYQTVCPSKKNHIFYYKASHGVCTFSE